jgi:hypothetical protein
MAVEIPDDDAPPPGWDQWASLPTPAPEPQAGALVRRWDGHMVAGGSRRGAEASSSHAGPPDSGKERVDEPPPLFADAQEEQQLWEELRDHGASLNRALNEALRIHGGPVWSVFQVRCYCFFFDLVIPVLTSRGAMLIGFRLLAGARAPHPRQVRRLRPDER